MVSFASISKKINYFLHGDAENRKDHIVMASKSHHEESIIIIISFPFMLQVKYLQIKTLQKKSLDMKLTLGSIRNITLHN